MNVKLALWSVMVVAVIAATGCAGFKSHNLPPAERLLEPGPGVGGPGPGVLPPLGHGGGPPSMPASLPGGMIGGGMGVGQHTVQVLFNRPEAMQVRWDVGSVGMFDSDPLIVPGRKNFPEGGIYRIKLTNIVAREGVELYPTLEIGPTTPRTAAYLAHNAIPVQFTEEDFDQVQSGNFVTKVIYLPDPEFQEMALAGVETLVSTRLDPGVDPIVEADRRGAIMAVVRLGNKDVEMPGSMAGGVLPASFVPGDSVPAAIGPSGFGPTGIQPAYVSGITGPTYGMPYTGTPIGLPGPPHIPFGGPAGFQKHVIKNRTPMHIPGPTEKLNIRVRQTPGFSYPKPPRHMWIREQNIHPSLPFSQPHHDRLQVVH